MLSSAALQLAYNRMYKRIREYIWDVNFVENLAELEIEIYKTFPDLDSARRLFRMLRGDMIEVIREDEDLESAVDAFQELIDSDEELYSKITKVREVVDQ